MVDDKVEDLYDLIAKAKLGEKDYLITTFYFQPDLTKVEECYAVIFHLLCLSLTTYWLYQVMREYDSAAYGESIKTIDSIITPLLESSEGEGKMVTMDSFRRQQHILGYYLILYHAKSGELSLECGWHFIPGESLSPEEEHSFMKYLALLETYAQEEPSANVYLELIENLHDEVHFRVSIDQREEGLRFYQVVGSEWVGR